MTRTVYIQNPDNPIEYRRFAHFESCGNGAIDAMILGATLREIMRYAPQTDYKVLLDTDVRDLPARIVAPITNREEIVYGQ